MIALSNYSSKEVYSLMVLNSFTKMMNIMNVKY